VKILLIHGANASPLCWKTLKLLLPHHDYYDFSYDICGERFERIVERAQKAVEAVGADAVIAHSFGSIVAWHALQDSQTVKRAVTIASPWAGSVVSDMIQAATMGLLPTHFFRSTGRRFVAEVATKRLHVPVMNVVATRSSFFPAIPNDGILPVMSQRSILGAETVSLHHSHNEILVSDDLMGAIRSALG
jgi:pimeloyl-ACP methyl ester carboxylesterase